MTGWSRAAAYLAVTMIAAGFILIGLAWNGAAEQDCIQCQFPYLISGGLGGLALVGTGILLALVREIRRAGLLVERRLDGLSREVAASRSVTAAGGGGAGPLVAAGDTYHRPGCRVVEGLGDTTPLAPATAVERGLTPCRVCQPHRPRQGAASPP